ncbi:zinc finger BED domain-containing protein 4-like [Dysidea avara]|uniref:zinc finger BED domain-containing protein 4-like n=1 Tax=Dysidea avara TaxID=196820 RepID=UPI00332F8269
MRPISIVRDKGLTELLAFLEPNYRPPSTTHVSAQIRKDFEDGKAAVKKLLYDNTSIALTTDIWTSRATQSFATTTVHFLDQHWNLTTCVLESVHFPGHHTCKILWDESQWASIVCVAHRLQNAVKHAVEKQSMQKMLAKCRRLVGHFKHSALATNGLIKKQKTLGFKKLLHVVQEVPTRWNSTFYMMQRLVQLKQPIRLYLEDTMAEDQIRSFDLSDHQWSVVKSILNLLEGVDQVTTTLSGESEAAEGSITASATNEVDHQTVEPPSKKRSVLDRLLGEEEQDDVSGMK